MSREWQNLFRRPTAAWADIEASLETLDLEAFRPKLAACLGSGTRQTSEWQGQIESLLQQELGAWYGGGNWHIGFEVLGGCWCHGFVRALEQGPDQATQWVLGELTRIAECQRALLAVFRRLREEVEFDWDGAIERVYEVMVAETSCNEAWYHLLADALNWLFQACTPAPPDPDWVHEQLSQICSSWVSPEPDVWQPFKHNLVSSINVLSTSLGALRRLPHAPPGEAFWTGSTGELDFCVCCPNQPTHEQLEFAAALLELSEELLEVARRFLVQQLVLEPGAFRITAELARSLERMTDAELPFDSPELLIREHEHWEVRFREGKLLPAFEDSHGVLVSFWGTEPIEAIDLVEAAAIE